MLKLIMMGMVGLILFCASAVGSWFVLQSASQTSEAAGDPELPPMPEIPLTNVIQDEPPPPVTAHPTGISAETVLRLSESIRHREEQLKQREALLEQREERVGFMMADLQRERDEINALFESMQLKTEEAQELLNQIGARAPAADESLSTATTADASANSDMTETELENLKAIAKWLQGMAPEQAAESLKQLSNNGQIEMAVRLLSFFEERNAAKVLTSMHDVDPGLVPELLERFKTLKPDRKSDDS